MKKLFFTFPLFLLFVSAFSLSVFAQTPKPTQTPTIEDDGEVVKITTTLIQLDVVVTDKKGNQVTDLKPEDFEVYENGKKQDITNLSYISSNSARQPIDANQPNSKKNDKLSAPIPPVKLKPEQIRRTYALVVDDLGLSFENVSTVKYALKKFVNEQMQAGDLVAIIRTGSGIGALQSFTSDRRQLFAAIEKIKWNPQGRSGGSAFAAVAPPLAGSLDNDKKNEVEQKINKNKEDGNFDQSSVDFRNENFTVGTLGALRYVIRGMRELPGRKSVLLFSEGFQMYSEENGMKTPTRILNGMRVLADLANRASVVIYTLDPRGLVSSYGLNADDNTFTLTGAEIDRQQRSRERKLFDSQDSLHFLAEETGGMAYVNQNRLDIGLRLAVEDQSGYYLIGYQPESDTFNPKKNQFNKFTVKVKRSDLKVRYRSGFFGVTDEQIAQIKPSSPTQQIYHALTSPFNTGGVSLYLNTVFGDDPKYGTFIRSLIYVDGKDIAFIKEADGRRMAKFDVLAMTFGDNGAPIDQFAKSFTMQVNEETYQKILAKGFIYNIPVPIKKAGAYQFRIALRDSNSEKVGSASQFVEVPNLKKKNLTLSGVLLDNFTLAEWRKISLGENLPSANQNGEETDADIDTAVRRYKRGTVLRYGYIIYNAKTPAPQIQVQTKLFRDGKPFLESESSSLSVNGQADLRQIQDSNTITLGNDLKTGSYVLQVVVRDTLANKAASQWIDFEIVE